MYLFRKQDSYSFSPVFRIIGFLLISVICSACQGGRPFVVTNTAQLSDLYWEGELTDTKENRWGVTIIPGVMPPLRWGKDSWTDAGEILQEYGKEEFWDDNAELFTDSWTFAKDAIVEYGYEGIGEDFSEASRNISANYQETPFGWIPRIVMNFFWGYLIKPSFRMATAPAGAALGASASIVLPIGYTLYPTFWAIGQSTFNGVIVPIAGVTGHQLIYIFVLPNREPSEDQDGSYGLYIIRPEDVSLEAITSEIEVSKKQTLGKKYLEKILAEYIFLKELQLRHSSAIKKRNLKELYASNPQPERQNWYENYEWEYTPEAEVFWKNQLRKEFGAKWQEMISNLDSSFQEDYPSEEEAYKEFSYLIFNPDVDEEDWELGEK